jgi:hypothetical protein
MTKTEFKRDYMKVSLRDYGVYWVFYNSRWITALFEFGSWYIMGSGDEYNDSAFTMIGDLVEYKNKPENTK